MAVDDTTEAQYRRPGHTHKQRRCVWSNIDGLVTNTSKAEVCVRQQGSQAQYRRPGHWQFATILKQV